MVFRSTWTGTRLERSCHRTRLSACWKSSKCAVVRDWVYSVVHVWACFSMCSSKRDWVVFLCLLGMGTCFFCTHPQLDPPARTWTQLSLTLLLHTPPSLLPPHHHLPYPAHTLHHRSQRMRLTSICPNRRERSTETETPSCESAFLSTLPRKQFLIYIVLNF